jgi:hypothetical protein
MDTMSNWIISNACELKGQIGLTDEGAGLMLPVENVFQSNMLKL